MSKWLSGLLTLILENRVVRWIMPAFCLRKSESTNMLRLISRSDVPYVWKENIVCKARKIMDFFLSEKEKQKE